MHTFDGTLIWRMVKGRLIIFLGKGITGLIEYHRLVIFFFEEFEKIDFFIHFSESLLEVFILRFKLSHIFSV